MHRRSFSTLAFATLAGMKAIRPASAEDAASDLETQLQRFKAFPGTTSLRIDVGDNVVASKAPGRQLFVASTIKTFIVCQYLRDVEAGRLSEDEQLSVDDNVRNVPSPVFLNLTGTTWARSILEASITHSDNTATDIALLHVGPDRVRSFIAATGLRATLIPDSTRRFFSYNFGAPLGVDIGWASVQQVLASGKSDDDVAAWITSNGTRKSPEEIKAWSDATEAVNYYHVPEKREWFAEECKRLGLDPARTTLFDYLEEDDRVSFRK